MVAEAGDKPLDRRVERAVAVGIERRRLVRPLRKFGHLELRLDRPDLRLLALELDLGERRRLGRAGSLGLDRLGRAQLGALPHRLATPVQRPPHRVEVDQTAAMAEVRRDPGDDVLVVDDPVIVEPQRPCQPVRGIGVDRARLAEGIKADPLVPARDLLRGDLGDGAAQAVPGQPERLARLARPLDISVHQLFGLLVGQKESAMGRSVGPLYLGGADVGEPVAEGVGAAEGAEDEAVALDHEALRRARGEHLQDLQAQAVPQDVADPVLGLVGELAGRRKRDSCPPREPAAQQGMVEKLHFGTPPGNAARWKRACAAMGDQSSCANIIHQDHPHR